MAYSSTSAAFCAYEIDGADRQSRWLVTCDHASNAVPPSVAGGDLGLPAADMARHIAYDIGAAGVSRALADALGCPAILSTFSRLVIDPNRGEDDPTLLMQLYDGTVIEGNRHLDAATRAARLELCYRPYHRALADLAARQEDTILVSVHSFTPQLAGRPKRPWQIGVLYAPAEPRLGHAMLERLADERDLCVGENQPYAGHLPGDSMDQHGLQRGRLNVLIELRNDLIVDPADQRAWGQRLAPILRDALRAVETPGL